MKRFSIFSVVILCVALFAGCGSDSRMVGGLLSVEEAFFEAVSRDESGEETDFQSGTLTCGECKDLEHMDFWTNLIRNNKWYEYCEERDLFTTSYVKVKVTDNGQACPYRTVTLRDKDDKAVFESVTDINGDCWLFANLKGEKETEFTLVCGEFTKKIDLGSENGSEIVVEAQTAAGTEKKTPALDVMFMIDTTGSMGDELQYLSIELSSIINNIKAEEKIEDVRVSVDFYRDEGDAYIIKTNLFTDDIDQAVQTVKNARADGGGDTPEAVHVALDAIADAQDWRSGNDVVKLCFFVLDAPPHSEEEIKGINERMQKALIKASAKGIRIIPVICSGMSPAGECFFRSVAILTNGTYVFLTDDSGYGDSHLEATVGNFEVEKLSGCIVRLAKEYCGVAERKVVSDGPQDQTGENEAEETPEQAG